MSTALMEKLADLPPEYRNEDQVQLFCSIVAPGVPADVVALCYHYAADLGLDPLRREVMPVAARARGDRGEWITSWNIIVGVWAVTKLMGRQPDYAGMRSGVVYPGERCVIKADGSVEHEYDIVKRSELFKVRAGDAIADPKLCLPVGAWATVTRALHGKERQFTSWMPFHQCAQTVLVDRPGGGKVKELRSIWAQRPDWMNEKCAIMPSVRKAFAHKLGRIYAPEEFGAVSTEGGAIHVPEGAPTESIAEVVNTAALAPARYEEPIIDVRDDIREAVLARKSAEHEQPDFVKDAEADSGPPPTHDEAMAKVSRACARAAFFFTDPERPFVKDTSSGAWLVDAEVLAQMQQTGPLLLTAASADRVAQAAWTIENTTNAKEAARGRA